MHRFRSSFHSRRRAIVKDESDAFCNRAINFGSVPAAASIHLSIDLCFTLTVGILRVLLVEVGVVELEVRLVVVVVGQGRVGVLTVAAVVRG